jgi:hypothetical protein
MTADRYCEQRACVRQRTRANDFAVMIIPIR